MKKPSTVISKDFAPNGVWWLNPAVAFSAPAIIAGFVSYITDSDDYVRFWRTPKYFDLSCFYLLVLTAVCFSFGCMFGLARRSSGGQIPKGDWKAAIPWRSVRVLFTVSYVLTVVAYAIWYAVGLKHGLNLGVIRDLIRGGSELNYNLREQYFPTIPGVTTCTQFGLTVVALAVPLGLTQGWRTVRWQCATIFVLAFVRALLNSERLAFIEIMVPFLVSYIGLRTVSKRSVLLMTRGAPFIAVTLLYFFFGLSEYFRSWNNYYAVKESNFWSFIGLRLMGYYATALNNGAMLWRIHNPLSLDLPLGTFAFLRKFPVIKDAVPVVMSALGQKHFVPNLVMDLRYYNVLSANANPEFSNPTGIYMPLVDYGVAGGLLYWLLCGVVCGYLYKEFKLRTASGVFLYPLLYIGLIEASRVLYWSDGRFFPGMFLLTVCVLFVFRKRERVFSERRVVAAES